MSRPADRRALVGIGAAWIGVGAIALGSVLAALPYRGTAGALYNPLTHYVSQLGEPGVSVLAPAFNAGLMVGGICFMVFMTLLAWEMGGRLRWLWGPIGVLAGLGGFFVGVFPMDQAAQHGWAAKAFFNLGWIAVALASVDMVIRHDARWPRWLAIVGAFTVVAFLAFLATLDGSITAKPSALVVPVLDVRIGFWLVPTLEWAVIVGILAWTFLAATTWFLALRRAHGAAATTGILEAGV